MSLKKNALPMRGGDPQQRYYSPHDTDEHRADKRGENHTGNIFYTRCQELLSHLQPPPVGRDLPKLKSREHGPITSVHVQYMREAEMSLGPIALYLTSFFNLIDHFNPLSKKIAGYAVVEAFLHGAYGMDEIRHAHSNAKNGTLPKVRHLHVNRRHFSLSGTAHISKCAALETNSAELETKHGTLNWYLILSITYARQAVPRWIAPERRRIGERERRRGCCGRLDFAGQREGAARSGSGGSGSRQRTSLRA
ncbi:hypothetical protein B0H11DRAFT_1908677 [Mycena galericulata]|nr:hypothetical protein B0H11DRAFT_1908677 [Mycena galericulata]